METSSIISLIGMFITNIAIIISYTIKMTNKIAELSKDGTSLRKDFEDHKIDNRETFYEIKQLLKEDRLINQDGHSKIMAIVTDVKDKLSDMRIDLLKQDNENLKKRNNGK